MATATLDGIATRYEVRGDGPPLLMYSPGGFDATVEKWSSLGVYARVKPVDILSPRYTCIMQPAVPITAGLKIARWAVALAHDRERLAESAAEALAVQFGGPVGALESFGAKGPAIRHRIALQLGLADRPSWQSHRNAWVDLLSRMGQVVLSAGKIARDVALLAQPEVGEMLEAPPREGVGASSAMPHKRNPVGCVHALAAAARLPGLMRSLCTGSSTGFSTFSRASASISGEP